MGAALTLYMYIYIYIFVLLNIVIHLVTHSVPYKNHDRSEEFVSSTTHGDLLATHGSIVKNAAP